MAEIILNRTYKTKQDKKYNILYVDDEEVNLRIFERAFKQYYEVFTATSGKEAIVILQENHLDLIMTDQRMPNMTGTQLLLKIVPKYPNIVRMIMTGFSDDKAITEVEEKVGLDKYLTKPWNKDDLKEIFDKALQERYENDQNGNADTGKQSKSLDLVESTLSLVESGESQELNVELDNLVEVTRSTKRPQFVQGDYNDLLQLKESLMPLQQEISLYIDDALIIYDHRSVNKNGYWFGECDDHLILASFHANTTAVRALTLNTFIGVMFTELVYKEHIVDTEKMLEQLSERISMRFGGGQENKNESLDMALLVVNKENEEVSIAASNHDIYFYSDSDEVQIIEGHASSISPGKPIKASLVKMETFDFKEMYLIPKNIIEETSESGAEELESLKQLLSEVHKYPMNMQRKMFSEYQYKCAIGLRL